MREIKFRGNDIESDVWFVGSYLEQYTKSSGWSVIGAHIARKVRVEGGIAVLTNEVDPETVGQFTGLKDKNGKEIYEGDVVAGALKNGVVERGIYEMYNDKSGIPTWVANRAKNSRTGYVLVCDKKFRCRGEVIGNIHENPDLIK